MPTATNFDSILVGYYEGKKLMYAARVRNGFVPALPERVFERFRGLERGGCPFTICHSAKGKVG